MVATRRTRMNTTSSLEEEPAAAAAVNDNNLKEEEKEENNTEEEENSMNSENNHSVENSSVNSIQKQVQQIPKSILFSPFQNLNHLHSNKFGSYLGHSANTNSSQQQPQNSFPKHQDLTLFNGHGWRVLDSKLQRLFSAQDSTGIIDVYNSPALNVTVTITHTHLKVYYRGKVVRSEPLLELLDINVDSLSDAGDDDESSVDCSDSDDDSTSTASNGHPVRFKPIQLIPLTINSRVIVLGVLYQTGRSSGGMAIMELNASTKKTNNYFNDEEEEIGAITEDSPSNINVTKAKTLVLNFAPLQGLHPPTYLNKLLFIGKTPKAAVMRIYNIRSDKLVYDFQSLNLTGNSKNIKLVATPEPDLVLVAEDKVVKFVHLKKDIVLGTISNNTTVESICFVGDKLLTGSGNKIHLWKLMQEGELKCIHTHELLPQDIIVDLIPSGGTVIITTRRGFIRLGLLDPLQPTTIVQRTAHASKPIFSSLILSSKNNNTVPGVISVDRDGGVFYWPIFGKALQRELSVYANRTKLQLKFKDTPTSLLPKANRVLVPPTESSRRYWDFYLAHDDFVSCWSARDGQTGPLLGRLVSTLSAKKDGSHLQNFKVSAFTLSPCGHHCIIGYTNGTIKVWNVQSGRLVRDTSGENGSISSKQKGKKKPGSVSRLVEGFNDKFKPKTFTNTQSLRKETSKNNKLHNDCIVGLSVYGGTLVSVDSSGKMLRWNLKTLAPLAVSKPFGSNCKVTATVTAHGHLWPIQVTYSNVDLNHKSCAIYVYDMESKIVSRKVPIDGSVNCSTLSEDCRRLYISHDSFLLTQNAKGDYINNNFVSVIDLPTNRLIDKLQFNQPIVHLDILSGYLATCTRSGSMRIWFDRSVLGGVVLNGEVPNNGFPMDQMDFEDNEKEDEQFESEEDLGWGGVEEKEPYPDMLTLSSLPVSYWKPLLNLDLIKERNKPKNQDLKKPEAAPFFLQNYANDTVASTTKPGDVTGGKRSAPALNDEWDAVWTTDNEEEDEEIENTNGSETNNVGSKKRKLEIGSGRRNVSYARSNLATILASCHGEAASLLDDSIGFKYAKVMDYMRTLGPSAVDLALQTLCNGVHDYDGLDLLDYFCQFIHESILSKRDFELVNVYLNRFLTLHSGVLGSIEDGDDDGLDVERRDVFMKRIRALKQVQMDASTRLRNRFQHTMCLLRHFSKMV